MQTADLALYVAAVALGFAVLALWLVLVLVLWCWRGRVAGEAFIDSYADPHWHDGVL